MTKIIHCLTNPVRFNMVCWSIVFIAINSIVKGSSFLAVMFLAATLDHLQFANFGLVYTLQTLISTFASVGIAEQTIGKLKKFSSIKRRQVCYFRATGMFYFMAVVTSFVGISIVLGGNLKDNLIPAFCAIFLGLTYAYISLQSGFQRIEEMHFKSVITSSFIPLIGTMGLICGGYHEKSLVGAFFYSLVGVFVSLLVLIVGGYLPGGKLARPKKLLSDLKEVAPYAATGVLGWLAGYGMNTVVGSFLSMENVAQYTFLLTVSSVIQMIATSMNMVWSPRFYILYNQGQLHKAMSSSLVFYRAMTLFLTVVILCVLTFFPTVILLFNHNLHIFGGLQIELSYLLIGCLFLVPWWCVQNYFYVNARGKDLFKLTLVSSISGIILWILFIIHIGSDGIYIGFLVNILVKSCFYSYFAWVKWRATVPWATVLLSALSLAIYVKF